MYKYKKAASKAKEWSSYNPMHHVYIDIDTCLPIYTLADIFAAHESSRAATAQPISLYLVTLFLSKFDIN